jgi:hypothetical protein
MVARGGFRPDPGELVLADGSDVRSVVIIGNVGGAMWPHFVAAGVECDDPLDTWTRRVLMPIAERFGADYVHPSDVPYPPIQRWAQRADDVWPSPIGLFIHAEFGLWHAYRGAMLFADVVADMPGPTGIASPCRGCVEQPCLTACPVGAFSVTGYDVDACRGHIRADAAPHCLTGGCEARRACPIAPDLRYGADQMQLHMAAFVGNT